MTTTPTGWPRISSAVFYNKPLVAIEWLCDAFGFEVRMCIEDDKGSVIHSELTYDTGLIMVGGTDRKDDGQAEYQQQHKSPLNLNGANTQSLCVYVDDVDAHYENAIAHGAKIFRELETTDYGEEFWADRTYGAIDPEGHHWWFMTRVRDSK
jgi:uncharacterized glyoxalase superfamily protein PhnB